jgi:hypothetical protein
MAVGSDVDFFTVDRFEEGKLLRLKTHFKMPGKAWLQFKAWDTAGGRARLIVTAFFVPRGLPGFLYWHVLYPIHTAVFSGLVRNLKGKAEDSPHGTEEVPGEV